MKRYLSLVFILLGVLVLVIGLRIKVYWNGIVAWGLAFICLVFAAYFTKYIPDEKQ